MISSPKVAAYVQKSSLEGKEDKKFVRFTFYFTPLTYDLAREMSPAVADALFRLDKAGAAHPISSMENVSFELGVIPLQTLELHPADDPAMDPHGVLLQSVQISSVSARKVFPDDPNFTLIFNAEVPKNSLAVQMMDKYFREKVWVTFAQMQAEMFPKADIIDTVKNPTCFECGERATWRDSEQNHLCDKDLRLGKGEVVRITTLESPAQAQARILKELEAKNATSAPAQEPEPTVTTGNGEKFDASHANRKRSKSRQAAGSIN